MSVDNASLQGKTIAGRYRVVSTLGSGATAIVYKVKDQSLGSYLALKLLRAEKMTEAQLIRFHREARVLSDLRHGNLVSILDFGMSEESIPYLVMDYVEGSTLRHYLKRNGPLTFEQAIQALGQVCDVIGYIHRQKLLHRDLKSSNFMVIESAGASRLQLKLLDFGLVKTLSEGDGIDLTRAGITLGTPTYMSPEQVRGEPADERSDIYAIGCLMHELLTGAVPYQGKTSMDTMKMHLGAEIPYCNPPGLSADSYEAETLNKIFQRCLAKDKDERFASVAELQRSLERLMPGALIHEEGIEEAGQVSLDQEHSPEAGGSGRPVFATVFVIASALVLIGLVAYFLMRVTADDFISSKSLSRVTGDPGTLAGDMLGKFPSFKGECNIIWHMMGEMTDRDVLAFTADSVPRFMSFCSMKKVTIKGLRHASTLPFLGVGLNHRHLTREQLSLFAPGDRESPLEVLYIRDNPGLNDEDLKCLSNLKHLKLLVIGDNNFSDRSLKYVADIPSINTLKLNGLPQFTGDGIKYLGAMPGLKRLAINRNHISRAGFEALSGMKKLEVLALQQTKLDKESLKRIAELPLRKLDLSGSSVRDQDLDLLAGMKSLKLLRLYSCPNITAAGISRFKKMRPDCDVDVFFREPKLDGDPVLLGEELSI